VPATARFAEPRIVVEIEFSEWTPDGSLRQRNVEAPGFGTEARSSSWKLRASLVAERALPGDATLFYSPTVIRPFGYYSGYYRNASPTAPEPIYPSLYWLGYSATRFNPDMRALEGQIARHKRVWFVTGYFSDRPRRAELARIEGLLLNLCKPGRHFFRGRVRLYTGCGQQ
jgi:hypothetical protein